MPHPMKNDLDLDSLTIASPCSARWDDMHGDAKKRHCADCALDVFDLGAMTRSEATSWLAEQQGRTCVRLHRRADGRVITRDCPIGVRARLARASKVAGGVLITCVALVVSSLRLRAERVGDGDVDASDRSTWVERCSARFDGAVDWAAHRTGMLRFCNCKRTRIVMGALAVGAMSSGPSSPPTPVGGRNEN